MPPWGLDTEREIHYGRLEAAKAFARVNRLNRVTLDTPNAWLGIAAPGKTYYDLREALRELGLDDTTLRHYGIRLLKIGMLFPMEATTIRDFARGLRELLVIEEKRAFCELFIRDILYNEAERPRILGKSDLEGRPLVPADAELDADRIAQIVATRLERRIPRESITARVALSGRSASARRRSRWRASRTSARAARTTVRRSCRRARSRAPASAATAWRSSWTGGRWGSLTWGARASSGSGWRPSPRRRTSSRTSATAPSSIRARSRSARRSPPARTSPTRSSTTPRSR